MRLGLLGLGRIGAFHAETLAGLPAVEEHPEPAQRADRPSSLSMLRRSRLVGRPAPRSRAATGAASSRGGGGGLLSM